MVAFKNWEQERALPDTCEEATDKCAFLFHGRLSSGMVWLCLDWHGQESHQSGYQATAIAFLLLLCESPGLEQTSQATHSPD